ncbi:Dabb family protein [Joostella sp.]|uniref:Dabb family protein n=1 Tax=Joostella sp. TaxID=2231138 RepID=UPI003A8D64BF
MKTKIITLLIVLLICGITNTASAMGRDYNNISTISNIEKDSLLRHVVLFKFKEDATKEDVKNIENAFKALPSKIKEIISYEWGLNNSPEGLNKGFTHCFFLTFKNEQDRAIYLDHKDHKAFGAILKPHLEDVLVLDYWASK